MHPADERPLHAPLRSLEQTAGEALRGSDAPVQAQKVERFVGNLENALELHQRLGEDSELLVEIETIRERVALLSQELREGNVEERKRQALQIVNSNAGRLLPDVDSERPYDPISLQIDDLTIKATGTDRDDYLFRDWKRLQLAFQPHCSATRALAVLPFSRSQSSSRRFLIMDWPSQVYFPKKPAREDETPEEPEFKDEDIEAVQKAFRVVGEL